MTNQTFAVGKVINGRISVTAVIDGKVVGYKRPVSKQVPTVQAPITRITASGETTTTRIVEAHEVPTDLITVDRLIDRPTIDSPFIKMANDNHKKQKDLKEQRLADIKAHNQQVQKRKERLDFWLGL